LNAPEAVGKSIGRVEDPDRRADVQRLMSRFTAAVGTHLAALPTAVVHHDLNDFNVLARRSPDGRHGVYAVLDFADALHTARVSELAIAVAYAMLRKPDPLRAAAGVVRGYVTRAELTDAELAVLFPMAAARLCVNAVTWTHRCAEGDHPYGRERMRHTWPAIARLARTPPELAAAVLSEAASVGRAAVGPVPVVSHLRPDAGAHVRRTSEPGEAATLRLGARVAVDASSPVVAPLDAVVEPGPWGDVLILRHPARSDGDLWSRWTALRTALSEGDVVAAGQPIGKCGTEELWVALFRSYETAVLARGLVPVSEASAWVSVSPDPAALTCVHNRPDDEAADSDAAWTTDRVLAARTVHFAPSQRSYYRRPMTLVRGEGSWLYDDQGRAYLDAINNVAHVGHSNPRVVRAASEQMARLNTNSRFLYEGIGRYASRLAALLPDPLEVVFLVCSGSEANDLAVRIARQVTGRRDMLVVDGAYHGNTTTVTGLSPDRYNGPGGGGPDPTTFAVERPDGYRGRFRYGAADAGSLYAGDVARVIAEGVAPAGFLVESVMGTAGSVFYPDGYLSHAFAAVRSAGGLCIADEVQVGFGRLGDVFWGFQAQGVVPDIVTMGKPMGNGHPMGAVVTTRAIADAFDSGMKYFNTFGGNPVSCATGLAVLDEISSRDLQSHAAVVGSHFKASLCALDHPLVGDVRGRGMYLGVELVRDVSTMEPAGAEALCVSELMKDEGVIVYPTGPLGNVLKIKPPLTFGSSDVDLFVTVLDEVLRRDW
jgi:4-aminobutyrate aminotransferase-like enzyme